VSGIRLKSWGIWEKVVVLKAIKKTRDIGKGDQVEKLGDLGESSCFAA
jgi:hypothetical protein